MVKHARNHGTIETIDLDGFIHGHDNLAKIHSEISSRMPIIAIICGIAKPIPVRRKRKAKSLKTFTKNKDLDGPLTQGN